MRSARQLLLALVAAGCGASGPTMDESEITALSPPQPSVSAQPMLAAAWTNPAPAEPAGVRVPALHCETSQELGYRKGRKFDIETISIDGRAIELETAKAYWAMQLAAAADGVALPIYSAFRSNEEQGYFFSCFKTCSCNGCARAARPGYSNHQSGKAIDFGQWDGVVDWLQTNGRRFRFYPTVAKEPWHWEHRPRKSKRRRAQWPDICPGA